MNGTPWLVFPQPNETATVRLFCFPYAGGGANTFRAWPAYLPPGVELCAIRLPGRESRLREPPFDRLDPLVETLLSVLQPALDRPFAFFGHSLGALITFELARQMQRQGDRLPLALFVSGHRAPQRPPRHPPVHGAPEAIFMDRLRSMNGTPEIIFQNPGLRALMLPILRADFAIWERYAYHDGAPLDCPIFAFGGDQDGEVRRDELEDWHLQTRHAFNLRMFEGDHFYLQRDPAPLLQAIVENLAPFIDAIRQGEQQC